jgi:uncharacterized protein with GYD domain
MEQIECVRLVPIDTPFEELAMTFITTIRFTAQGAANAKDTVQRANAFKTAARKLGVKVKAIYWTLGRFDGVLIFEAPDEETATAAMLQLASQGNVQTQTARAYDAAEMEGILGKLAS